MWGGTGRNQFLYYTLSPANIQTPPDASTSSGSRDSPLRHTNLRSKSRSQARRCYHTTRAIATFMLDLQALVDADPCGFPEDKS